MDKGRELLGSHQFQDISFQKKSQIKTPLIRVLNSVIKKLLVTSFCREAEKDNEPGRAVPCLPNLCARGRAMGQTDNSHPRPTVAPVGGTLAQQDRPTKAPPGQRCRVTFIQKENVALALNTLTMLFKVLPPATCPISAITLFGFSVWIIAIIWIASHIFHNELWLPVFICLLFSLEILTCLQSEHYVSVTRCRIAPFLLGGHLLFSPLLRAFGMNRRLRVCSCSCDWAWCGGSQTRHVWEHWLPA